MSRIRRSSQEQVAYYKQTVSESLPSVLSTIEIREEGPNEERGWSMSRTSEGDFRMFDVDSSKGSSDVIIGTCQDAWYNKKSDYFYSD